MFSNKLDNIKIERIKMNWYKQSQLNKESGIMDMGKAFMGITIPAIALLLGVSILDVGKKVEQNPQQLSQEIQQAQQESQEPQMDNRVAPQQVAAPPVQKEQSGNINLAKIWQIESTSGKDPNMKKPNSSGALGHFQFLKPTWDEMIGLMGKNWNWRKDALDYNKSRAVADYYLNKKIPSMLKHYKIPDTLKTRIACYSWGVGYLNNAYKKYGEKWEQVAPQETKDYFIKYGIK
jgi:hypothetical protein